MRLTRLARLKLFSSLSRDTALSETLSILRGIIYSPSYRVTKAISAFSILSREREIEGREGGGKCLFVYRD